MQKIHPAEKVDFIIGPTSSGVAAAIAGHERA
jgi:hypothetical protein